MKRTKGSGRLNEKQLKFLMKTAAQGKKHPEKRKIYVVLLVVLLLWFYLVSFLIKHRTAALCGSLLLSMALLYALSAKRTDQDPGDAETPAPKQEQLWEMRDNIMEQPDLPEPEKTLTFIDALKEENEDAVGWLTIPGTIIDYPVMQTPEDEDYYLYRDFYGNDDNNGCLLLAAGCDITKKSTNWIIHGHNKKSGAMFGSLSKYRKKAYMEEHSQVILETSEGRKVYEIISVFESKVFYENDKVFKYYQCYDISDREDFDYFYENIKKLSLYDIDATAEYGDRFLTLSTCSYHTENGRLVVVAKEVLI